jgi:hypothetical protein
MAWQTQYKAALDSPRWQQLRRLALQRAGNRCEGERDLCPERPDRSRIVRCGKEVALQMHHLHYGTLGRETLSDVRMLCDDCHKLATDRAILCPMCGDSVFHWDEDAESWMESMFQLGYTSVSHARESEQPMCDHCQHLMDKDD